MTLLELHNFPFAVAIGLMVVIAVLQIIGIGDLFDGGDADVGVDVDIDPGIDGGIDADGANSAGFLDGTFSLLGIGRVPLLIWLMVFLVVFAAIGVAGQELAISLLGSPLNTALAGLGAGVAAVPVNSVLSRPLGRLMPKDETTAVSVRSLIRRDAEIQIGTARRGSPARSKVIDEFGHPHFVMVEPHDDDASLVEGEVVMLVRREGETFYAVQYESSHLKLS